MKKEYVYNVTDRHGYSGTCSFLCNNKEEADDAVRLYIRQWNLDPADYTLLKVEGDRNG